MNTNQEQTRIVEVGEANFEAEVLKTKGPVIVAFSAPWSRPCHVLESVLDDVAATCESRVKVLKVNADNNPDLSLLYDIQSVPTLLFFVDGSLSAKTVGTISKAAIRSRLQAVCRHGDSKPLTRFTEPRA